MSISATHYPPTLEPVFTGASPPGQIDSYQIGHREYFNDFRNETISRFRVPKNVWVSSDTVHTPHPDVSIYKNSGKYLKLPQSNISMLDAGRQQEVDDFYTACQMHREQYKDHHGALHPLDYFKRSDYLYQCPLDPTSVYLKYPTYYTKYKDPIVFPLSYGRTNRLPALPSRALTGVYNKNSITGRD
ncbi:ciliary microtubule inner protein 2C-like [Rhynchophorus ferrugineus]|uniref:Uncharacterized protein n=1 Tax=Rhynchophorus ferrugineus TaxID=354439 RepID=A0A834MJN9_RHYFE|nr:hypothetical protein GWI33_005398 [Rhynchophorus ferrugineus]